jgi:hypothetical protein
VRSWLHPQPCDDEQQEGCPPEHDERVGAHESGLYLRCDTAKERQRTSEAQKPAVDHVAIENADRLRRPFGAPDDNRAVGGIEAGAATREGRERTLGEAWTGCVSST